MSESAGRPPKYKWKQLLHLTARQKTKTLTRGKDFDCQSHTFGLMARERARRMGLNLSFSLQGDHVVITRREA